MATIIHCMLLLFLARIGTSGRNGRNNAKSMLGDSKLLILDCFSLSFVLLRSSIGCAFRCFNL